MPLGTKRRNRWPGRLLGLPKTCRSRPRASNAEHHVGGRFTCNGQQRSQRVYEEHDVSQQSDEQREPPHDHKRPAEYVWHHMRLEVSVAFRVAAVEKIDIEPSERVSYPRHVVERLFGPVQ